MKSDSRFEMRIPSKLKADASVKAEKKGFRSLAEVIISMLEKFVKGKA